VEETLIETGQVESVYQMRRSFQQAMEDEFRQVVEKATGRKVIAYMSSINVEPDLAVEIFVMEPIEEYAPPDPAPAQSQDGAGPESHDGAGPESHDGAGLSEET
jgi:hypothetical protein